MLHTTNIGALKCKKLISELFACTMHTQQVCLLWTSETVRFSLQIRLFPGKNHSVVLTGKPVGTEQVSVSLSPSLTGARSAGVTVTTPSGETVCVCVQIRIREKAYNSISRNASTNNYVKQKN